MAEIVVHAHYRDLREAGPDAHDDRLRAIVATHFAPEPWEWLPRLSARHSFTAPDRPDPEGLLRRLCDLDAAGIAERALRRLTEVVPPPTGWIECHILPSLPSLTQATGGCSYAPGKMMISLGDRDVLDVRLLRNVAHEYSHSVRLALFPQDERHGWGPAPPSTVRAYLVMEGLADALADHFYPWDRPEERLPKDLEPKYWEVVGPHLGESENVYVKDVIGDIPGLPAGAGYAAGARLVRSFLDHTETNAVDAQTMPWEDIWYRSAYPFAR